MKVTVVKGKKKTAISRFESEHQPKKGESVSFYITKVTKKKGHENIKVTKVVTGVNFDYGTNELEIAVK